MKKDEEDLARRTETAAATPPHVVREASPAPKPGLTQAQRQAAHDAKVQAQQAQDAADAPKRAENIAQFEKKKADSEKRLADIAAKKAAKEEKQRKQQAEAAAKAAQDAATAAAKAAAKAKP
jgi:colicin import membrane protein